MVDMGPYRRRIPCAFSVAVSAAIIGAVGAASTQGDVVTPPERISVELTGPATVYANVRYEIARRRGAVVVTIVKTFAEGFGQAQSVGLMADDDLATLWESLRVAGAFELKSRRDEHRRARWRIELQQGGARHVVVVDDPELHIDRRAHEVLRRILAVTRGTAGAVPFRDALLLPDEAGILRIDARPPARVAIEGVWLSGSTPIVGLRVPAGHRTVRLEALDGSATRDYEVTVDAGRTTRLVVELD